MRHRLLHCHFPPSDRRQEQDGKSHTGQPVVDHLPARVSQGIDSAEGHTSSAAMVTVWFVTMTGRILASAIVSKSEGHIEDSETDLTCSNRGKEKDGRG